MKNTAERELIVEGPSAGPDSMFTGSTKSSRTQNLVVNRQQCLNPILIDTFLRKSRAAVDSVVDLRLNHLSNSQSNVLDSMCSQYAQMELIPAWETRNQVIDFCATEASSLKKELAPINPSCTPEQNLNDLVRLNPYAADEQANKLRRHYQDLTNLESWINNQRTIEKVLRSKTLRSLSDVCEPTARQIDDFFKASKGF
ncbi:HEL040Cp [Eremothecium sinecaudum]|uniref:HEL040Cp n=1 Tax=Eremothecium sinecaudum TaxID=45286 RepID=A0A120K2D8_9SACH|nr:HEL040Cp [Eremothecium sinecaudum]AMD21240.1 HEL040Cp [Eremothecium sinecaudum]